MRLGKDESEEMAFEYALQFLRFGRAIRRSSWRDNYIKIDEDGENIVIYRHKTNGSFSVWIPKLEDILIMDWRVI